MMKMLRGPITVAACFTVHLRVVGILIFCSSCDGGKFFDCPYADVEELAQLMSSDPRPRRIRYALAVDTFSWSDHGSDAGFRELILSSENPYILTNAAFSTEILQTVAERFPMPSVVANVNQRPVLSLGLDGTGEVDIAHHYHPITVMLLLQGEKIWALREPTDVTCLSAIGDCTDPFDVCHYYRSADSPTPACVQRPGDVIIVPDGWYHGTCNNASLTVGWGGQGKTLALDLEAGRTHVGRQYQPLFATLLEPPFGASILDGLLFAVRQLKKFYGDGVEVIHYHKLGPPMQAWCL